MALFTKPVALLMIFLFYLEFILLVKDFLQIFKNIIFNDFLNYSFFLFGKVFQFIKILILLYKNKSNIWEQLNWTAIRSGYIDYGEGTDLHNRLIEKGQN